MDAVELPFRVRGARQYSPSSLATLAFTAPGDIVKIDDHWYTILSLRATNARQEFFVVALHDESTNKISCNTYPGTKQYEVFRLLRERAT